MTAIRLSLCIPTYNFGRFIAETLRAIASQATGDVEIVVLDGGSTDDTPEIVERFAREVPGVVHRRLERPGGIDADLATTISLASGEYCWLMSSDDAPAPGAIARVLREIESGEDVYLCNRLDCDNDLRPLRQGSWLSGSCAPIFRLSERNDLERYLAEARSIGALFSYMSAIVVRRAAWDASPPDPKAVGTNYAHVARLLSALLRGGTLRYLETPLVLCRGENDSFARGGVVRRFLIDLDGYLVLADLLPDAATRRAFLRVMRLEHPWYVFAEIRSCVASRDEWPSIRAKLLRYGYARWQVRLVGLAGAIPPIMALARLAWFGARRLRNATATLRRTALTRRRATP